jgi:putative two-component system response regulator
MPTVLSEQPELAPLETTQRRRILIVDDDEALVDLLSRRLQQQGYETVTADTGHAGLALARREPPALVILDLRLPDVDGFSICQQLVDSPETCNIPVIMLSGMERPDIIRRCRAAGCYYFVRKPYDPNALLVLIRQAITEAGPWDELAE